MIEKTQSFKTSDGKIHDTIELAQAHELIKLMGDILDGIGGAASDSAYESIATLIVKRKEEVIDILTTGPRSKPKARKINKKEKLPNAIDSKK